MWHKGVTGAYLYLVGTIWGWVVSNFFGTE